MKQYDLRNLVNLLILEGVTTSSDIISEENLQLLTNDSELRIEDF